MLHTVEVARPLPLLPTWAVGLRHLTISAYLSIPLGLALH